ncbi:MAG: phosphatase PAP2 family protein [Planctomycetia bacterium]
MPARSAPVVDLPPWACRLKFHALFLVLGVVAFWWDESVFHRMNDWYNGPNPVNGELNQLILSAKMYGQTLGIGMTIALIWTFDAKHRGRAAVLGVMLAVAGLGSAGLKASLGRERPLDADGRTVFHGPDKGVSNGRYQSMPSGHTATAVALSYGLARIYPAGGPLFSTLAVGVGVNRVVTVRHFLSDVVAGAWLGFMLAAYASRQPWVWTMEEKLSQRLAPREDRS